MSCARNNRISPIGAECQVAVAACSRRGKQRKANSQSQVGFERGIRPGRLHSEKNAYWTQTCILRIKTRFASGLRRGFSWRASLLTHQMIETPPRVSHSVSCPDMRIVALIFLRQLVFYRWPAGPQKSKAWQWPPYPLEKQQRSIGEGMEQEWMFSLPER